MKPDGPQIMQELPLRFAPQHTALLIIDMQKDFCVDGYAASRAGRPLHAAQSIIPTLQNILAQARAVGVLVCHVGFWTLPDHMSDSGAWLAQRRRSTFASDRIALAETDGARFIDELRPDRSEVLVHKHRYSAFKGTDLDMILHARDVRSVVLTGVSTNVCVESSLRDAFELGYYVGVASDGCASWDEDLHKATLRNVEARFGVVFDSATLKNFWAAA